MDKFQVCVIGAGSTGLAVAYQLSISPGIQGPVVLLESESGFGRHTSSRSSEVIHAGIYYPENSLKAQLCVRGKQLLYEFCGKYRVAHSRIGKFIVASGQQLDALERVRLRAAANGVDDLEWTDRARLQAVEPALAAEAALFSPSTGIIDSHGYMQSLLHLAEMNAVHFAPYTEVTRIEGRPAGYLIDCRIDAGTQSQHYSFAAEWVVNCAGLRAQAVAGCVQGLDSSVIPPLQLCKGDYFSYLGRNPFRHLIYPLPEPALKGLGIHATLDLAGQLRFGPDTEFVSSVDYSIDAGKADAFAAAIGRYFPAVDAQLLAPAYAGIRPKLAGSGSEQLDFVIDDGESNGCAGLIQLFGIESPGLTASLAIGERVAGLISA